MRLFKVQNRIKYENYRPADRKKEITACLTRSGLLFLSVSLLVISAPRSWSLYPLGLFLFCGLLLWIMEFRYNFVRFIEHWPFVIAPLIYFIVHLLSVIFQGGKLLLLENRLMFLLIPLFGLPVFYSGISDKYVISLIKAFLTGITLICALILFRAFYIAFTAYNAELSSVQSLKEVTEIFFFTNLSVFEHPSYLAMKINWAIILFAYFRSAIIKSHTLRTMILFFLSGMIFLLASKSGIVLWVIIMTCILIRNIRKKAVASAYYFLTVPLFLLLSFIAITNINRFEDFFNTIKTGLNEENTDWKDLDHRTREWYSALQIIREKPLAGAGLAGVEQRMVDEFLKHGWEEEAFHRFNAHNQLLEAQMTFGIAGSISLMAMLGIPFFMRRRTYFPALSKLFILLFSFQLVVESMLNRQWGIMFFLLFYFILSKPVLSSDPEEQQAVS
ncbi:MAG: O-antigen ligase family protein [Bacteroidales bacterium]|nr:O-antigen ligase family protein [Bacteroidales bacterium]